RAIGCGGSCVHAVAWSVLWHEGRRGFQKRLPPRAWSFCGWNCGAWAPYNGPQNETRSSASLLVASACRSSARYGLRLARVGRSDPLILAARERHREGTGVELSLALVVCV